MSTPTELRARAAELEQRVPPIHAGLPFEWPLWSRWTESLQTATMLL